MNQLPNQSIFNKDFILLFTINFVSHAGLQMFVPIMSKYAVSLGFPKAWLGLVVSAYAFMIFGISLFSGSFVDRISKKTLLLIALMAQPFAILGYAFVGTNMYLLIALRMFHGMFAGMIMIVSMAMISFVLPKNKLGMGMGIYGLGQTLAMAVGPFIGIFLVENFGFRNMFLVSAVVVTIAAMLSFFITAVPIVNKSTSRIAFRDLILVSTIPVSILGFLNNTAYSSLTAYLVLHADQQNVGNIGLFFTLYSVVLLMSRPLVGKISDRLSLKSIIYPASLLLMAAMLLSAYASSLWMFLVAAVLMGIGFGGSQPVIQAACIRDVVPQKRGAASATFMMGQSLGFIVGPMGGGYIASRTGFGNMFAVMAGTAVLSIAVMTAIEWRRNKQLVAVKPDIVL